MSLIQSTAEDDQPTPDPSSAVLKTGRDDRFVDTLASAVDEAQRLYGSETSDAWLAALVDGTHPLCRVATPGCADDHRPCIGESDLVTDAAMLEAAERYAGDTTHDRELEDLQAGRHPLQRRPPRTP